MIDPLTPGNNKRFGLPIWKFELTVPVDYRHGSQIDTSIARIKNRRTTRCLNYGLTSSNFVGATTRLLPGNTYKAKIFPVNRGVTTADCMAFYRKQGAIFVGGQGITLVYDLKEKEFPIGKRIISFDKEEALWKDAYGSLRIPCMYNYYDGWGFDLACLEDECHKNDCVLCFYNM